MYKRQLVQLLIDCRGQSFPVLLYDHRSDPLLSRAHAMEQLIGTIDHLDGHPFLLLGDFNLPVTSAHIDPLRDRLTNAFDVAGSGLQETWCRPLPLLSLDQAWIGGHGGIQARRCFHVPIGRSRHEAIVLDLSITANLTPEDIDFPAPYQSPKDYWRAYPTPEQRERLIREMRR